MRRTLFPLALALALALVPAVLAGFAAPMFAFAAGLTSFLTTALLSIPLALRGALLLPFFTRLQKDRLLDHGVRPRIVDLLASEPGLGITDVRSRLDIGWGNAVHHLTRLEDAGLVVSQDSGRRRRFFLAGETPARRTAVCVLSTDLNRRIVEHVRRHPGTSQRELCQALGISAPLAHKYLARLIDHAFVAANRQWRTLQYFPGASLEDALTEYERAQGSNGEDGPWAPA